MRVRVHGQSMGPEFKEGSIFFASKWLAKKHSFGVGDVVVVRDPRESNRLLLKRIAKIEEGSLWLLGDNQSASTDSRVFGSVEGEKILAKVMFKYPTKKGFLAMAMMVVAALGVLDASYLTYEHFSGGEVVCLVGPEVSCDIVLGSAYATILGVPVALLGVFYYAAMLLLVWLHTRGSRFVGPRHLLILSSLGFAFSLYLLYLQTYVLYAYCFFCVISALTAITLFVLAILLNLPDRGMIKEKDE